MMLSSTPPAALRAALSMTTGALIIRHEHPILP
jgi:hypothetical protein